MYFMHEIGYAIYRCRKDFTHVNFKHKIAVQSVRDTELITPRSNAYLKYSILEF